MVLLMPFERERRVGSCRGYRPLWWGFWQLWLGMAGLMSSI